MHFILQVTLVLTFSGLWLINITRGSSIEIDLQRGRITGQNRHVTILQSPLGSSTRKCDGRGLLRVHFAADDVMFRFDLQYASKPRLWTFDVSDSASGDGYGGDNGSTSNMAEVHIRNRQLRMYSNSLPGYYDVIQDGTYLMRVADDVIDESGKISVDKSNERVAWTEKGKYKFEKSKFLFTLAGQNVTHGVSDRFIYVGLNRVVANEYRSGTGLCKVKISMFENQDGRHHFSNYM